jgi:cytochrome c-type biogenesis protein CcmH/NrfG
MRTVLGDYDAARAALSDLRQRHPKEKEALDAVARGLGMAAVGPRVERDFQNAFQQALREDPETAFSLAAHLGRGVTDDGHGLRLSERPS